MIWQHKEEQQKQKQMNDLYKQIREEYKHKLADSFTKQIGDSNIKELQNAVEQAQDHDDQLLHLIGVKNLEQEDLTL